MSSQRRPLAIPSKRPIWRDPRFIGGLALIAVSVLACTWLVHAARSGVAVYQASRDIAIGEPLDSSNTTIINARPESDAYVTEGALQPGAVAGRSIAEGELVAKSSVTTEEDEQMRRIVVTAADGLPATVGPGTVLELWALPGQNLGSGAPAQSSLIASEVTLISIVKETSGLARSGTRIEILVRATDLSAILDAMSGGTDLAAVPVGSA